MATVKIGTNGADTLKGFTGENFDLRGGLGDDLYILNYLFSAPDTDQPFVTEAENAGKDTVLINYNDNPALFYQLGANIENLTVNAFSDLQLIGNTLNNLVTANTVFNTSALIIGGGGKDTLVGGDSNTTYVVDSSDDVITEVEFGGYDEVFSTASYVLSANIEELGLQGFANINGTGNALDNEIEGNDGNNSLFGLGGDDALEGGAGKDMLDGGAGDDYLVGHDGMFGEVDTLMGGIGDDALESSEADGVADSLNGGAGNDVYIIYAPDKDIITEAAAGGNDTVVIYASNDASLYTLGANVENAEVTDGVIGTLTGNVGDNNLLGNDDSENIILNGLGGNDVLDGNKAKMFGGDGNDSYVVNQFSDQVTETNALVAGGLDTVYASQLFSYTLGANVENLSLVNDSDFFSNTVIGRGNSLNNLILGNYVDNELIGGAGNDTLNGGLGEDDMKGGTGNDTYYVDNSDDSVVELENEGTDKIILTADFDGFNYSLEGNVEQLDASAYSFVDMWSGLQLTGNKLANTIIGTTGDDTLDGRGGDDNMTGGAGFDTYFVDSNLDKITELAGTDIDTVFVTGVANYTMAANVEIAYIFGGVNNVTGNTADNDIRGNGNANSIVGGVGSDYLEGGYGKDTLDGGVGNDTLNGGAGVDLLMGGAGDDTYYVTLGDKITNETAGMDTVFTAQSIYDLSNTTDNGAGVINIDKLAYTGFFGAFTATGNALANAIAGGNGSDTLSGGAGNDTLDGGLDTDLMTGGIGNDTYYVNVFDRNNVDTLGLSDIVVEVAAVSGGMDTVITTVGYEAAIGVENVVAQQGVVGANFLGGNTQANTLTGNEFNNTFDGGNDTLADTMIGGAGDDFYFVHSANDVVSETLTKENGGGFDTVTLFFDTNINYTLGTNVDALNMSVITANVNGTGNLLDNVLTGGEGNNTLSGLGGNDTLNGGDGVDTLIGGAGDDVYEVDSNTDIITEKANEGIDTVRYTFGDTYTLAANVENADFTGVNSGGAIIFTGNASDNLISTLLITSPSESYAGGGGIDTLAVLVGAFGPGLATTNLNSIEHIKADIGTNNSAAGPFTDPAETQYAWNLNGSGDPLGFHGTANNHNTITITGRLQPDDDGIPTLESGALQLVGVGENVDLVLKDYSRDADRGGIDILDINSSILNVTLDNFDGSFRANTGGVDPFRLTLTATGDASDVDVGNIDIVGSSLVFTLSGEADLEVDNISANTNMTLKNYSGSELSLDLSSDGTLRLNLENTFTDLVLDGSVQSLNPSFEALTLAVNSDSSAIYLDGFGGGEIAIVDGFDFSGGSLSLALGDIDANTTISAQDFQGQLSLDLSDSFGGLIDVTGGSGDDYITGSNSNDTINGGLGADVIFGGDGNDTFRFDTFVYNANMDVDTIFDFASGADKIELSASAFEGLGMSLDTLVDGVNFFSDFNIDDADLGTTDAVILYDFGSGALFYDQDGSGVMEAQQFAQLTLSASLSASDISLV